MRTVICIDDTDNLDSRGTGSLASLLIKNIEERRMGVCAPVTRHQLFVHPDVPYTSHNSAMCFTAEIEKEYYHELVKYCGVFLENESAEGSDPGLCIARPDFITNIDLLINFGKKAKVEVLSKEKAYLIASSLGVHLSEHGGTGQGVIGALAGTGLRISGSDGRFRGKHNIISNNNTATVRNICKQANIDIVQTVGGEILNPEETVILGEKIKSIFKNHKSVLLVFPVNNSAGPARWKTCPKDFLRRF